MVDDPARWYGPWAGLTPPEVQDLLIDFDRPWWIVGGWALERATGLVRTHDDIDVSIAHHDAPALRDHLLARGWTTWNADDGSLRPYDRTSDEIRPGSGIWVRADAMSPWILDVPLTPFSGRLWTNKRVPSQTSELDAVTWVDQDGVRFLNPEIVLFMKARQQRRKDVDDAAAAIPLLTPAQRAWLAATVRSWDPAHAWGAIG